MKKNYAMTLQVSRLELTDAQVEKINASLDKAAPPLISLQELLTMVPLENVNFQIAAYDSGITNRPGTKELNATISVVGQGTAN